MEQALQQLEDLRKLNASSVTHWVDIVLVALLIYRLLLLIKGTRSWRIVFGIASFVILLILSKYLKLDTLNFIFDRATSLGPVALVILFLPEMRQALEQFGRFWPQTLGGHESSMEAHTIEEIVAAASEMAEARTGAIIVIEREARLETIVSNGALLNAKLSAPLLGAVFYEGNPLHDGAAIVRGDTVIAAACRLPLSDSTRLDSHVHMRHRAAVGVTETSDCVVVVVSEERGRISVAVEGRLELLGGSQALRQALTRELRGEGEERKRRLRRAVAKRQKAKAKEASAPAAELESGGPSL